MAKKIILEVTERELEAVASIIQTLEAMLGCSDGNEDKEIEKELKLVQRIFTKNGYESPLNLN